MIGIARLLGPEVIAQLEEQFASIDIAGLLRDLTDWQDETKSDAVYSVLDTVIDIVLDNCYFTKG